MKKVYFRIIELVDYQVMLMKDFGHEEADQDHLIVIHFMFDGVLVKQTLGFSEEERRDFAFNEFTDQMAQELVNGVSRMLTEN